MAGTKPLLIHWWQRDVLDNIFSHFIDALEEFITANLWSGLIHKRSHTPGTVTFGRLTRSAF